jgi:hypothetical protein
MMFSEEFSRIFTGKTPCQVVTPQRRVRNQNCAPDMDEEKTVIGILSLFFLRIDCVQAAQVSFFDNQQPTRSIRPKLKVSKTLDFKKPRSTCKTPMVAQDERF